LIQHPNAKTVWTTIEAEAGQIKTVLVVETDLTLNPSADGYDGDAVNDLVDETVKAYGNVGTIDRIRFTPIKPD